MRAGNGFGGGRKIGWPHVGGRRVDQVARHEGRGSDSADFLPVNALGQNETRPVALAAAVAREAICAERESERRIGRRAVQRTRQPIIALRQRRRQGTRQKGVRAVA